LLFSNTEESVQCAIQAQNKKLKQLCKENAQFKEQWKIGAAQVSKHPYQALFYLDFLAPLSDLRSVNALVHLAELAPFIRVLGSYQNVENINQQELFNQIFETKQ